jgi:dipeptidyl aminopeptidase/acylaminoacyl peptidase
MAILTTTGVLSRLNQSGEMSFAKRSAVTSPLVVLKETTRFQARRSWLALCLIILGASHEVHAVEPVTVRDVFELQVAEKPNISPDGKWVVYERHFNDPASDKQYSNLWVMTIDGEQHRALTTGRFVDRDTQWSEDGSFLVFTSDREPPRQIYRYDFADGKLSPLTQLEKAPSGISLSPDGSLVSFVALVPAPPRVIAELPEPPPGAKWAEPPLVIDQLRYRWDGLGYLERGMMQVFVVSSRGGEVRQVSESDHPYGGSLILDSPQMLAGTASPVWSPDGQYLYVATVRREDPEYNVYDTEIFRITLSTGKALQLTDRRGPDAIPVVSPDGKHIAYIGYDDHLKGYQVVQLYVMNSDGTDVRTLTAKLDRDVANVSWSADGQSLYFTLVDQGNTKLARVSLEGEVEFLASNLGSRPTAYPTGSYSVASDGSFIYTDITANRFGQLVRSRPGATTPSTTLLDVNEAVFAGRPESRVEMVQYPSSFDGREIQGWIVYPPDFDKSQKYPLILEIHGGPFANYGARFSLNHHTMAARGYVVLYTNPRGSTSYGADFGNLIHHAYPGNDWADLESGIDVLSERGFIDQRNIFIAGGSGGAILGSWGIGKTDRFRAAAILYPAVNFTSWTLTSDKAFKLSRYFFPSAEWNDPGHYLNRSPLSLAQSMKTPTIILTGEEDYRTPLSESEQLYTALKLNHVEAVLVVYPGENHGIGRRPSNTISTVEHTLGWFDKHRVH